LNSTSRVSEARNSSRCTLKRQRFLRRPRVTLAGPELSRVNTASQNAATFSFHEQLIPSRGKARRQRAPRQAPLLRLVYRGRAKDSLSTLFAQLVCEVSHAQLRNATPCNPMPCSGIGGSSWTRFAARIGGHLGAAVEAQRVAGEGVGAVSGDKPPKKIDCDSSCHLGTRPPRCGAARRQARC
jgi:hypothetical protein